MCLIFKLARNGFICKAAHLSGWLDYHSGSMTYMFTDTKNLNMFLGLRGSCTVRTFVDWPRLLKEKSEYFVQNIWVHVDYSTLLFPIECNFTSTQLLITDMPFVLDVTFECNH